MWNESILGYKGKQKAFTHHLLFLHSIVDMDIPTPALKCLKRLKCYNSFIPDFRLLGEKISEHVPIIISAILESNSFLNFPPSRYPYNDKRHRIDSSKIPRIQDLRVALTDFKNKYNAARLEISLDMNFFLKMKEKEIISWINNILIIERNQLTTSTSFH